MAKVSRPLKVTDEVLVSSTAVESPYSPWVATGNYAQGNRVLQPNHHVYENVIAGVNSTLPENACTGASRRWIDCGMSNVWAMFDDDSDSATVASGSFTVVLHYTGFVTCLYLGKLVGLSASVSVESAGVVRFSRSYSLDGTIITDWREYFTEPMVQRKQVVITDIPPYYSPRITITISGLDTVACATCQAGVTREIGIAQMGSGWGFINYSTVTIDQTFGTISTYVPRGNKNTRDILVIIENSMVEAFLQTMDALLNKFCVWIPSERDLFKFMASYGFCSKLDVVIKNTEISKYNLVIRGL
jgi:hypothetical protein